MLFSKTLVAGAALATLASASPTRTVKDAPNKRQDNAVIESLVNQLELYSQSGQGVDQALYNGVAQELMNIVPTNTPTSVPQASSLVASIYASEPTSLADQIRTTEQLILNGFGPADFESALSFFSAGDNSYTNVNTREPSPAIYPSAAAGDAPYSLSEETLRATIHIPDTFTYGKKPPVIMVPGTGERGGMSFAGNLRLLLQDQPYADLVWINNAGNQLDDAQANAETVAYAINYISAVSGHQNVSLIGWSQGNPDILWATKYWPSARSVVSDHIAISPDYHGTVLAPFVCSEFVPVCPPSLIQQEYNAAWIEALRSNGGDSAYVPTTNIFSGFFDEIVEPQQGTNASGYLNNAHGAGVTNAEFQVVCPNLSPGSVVFHESALGHPLTWALTQDALNHEGPADIARINTTEACNGIQATGLGFEDFMLTESLIPVAVVNILLYKDKTTVEPPIMSYAI